MPRATDITVSVSEDGRIPRETSRFVRDQLKLYAGGEVRIRISKPKRTTRANAYYWAAVIEDVRLAMIDAGIGFMETNDGIKAVTAEAIHSYFKQKYLAPRPAVVFGEDMTLEPTTTTLNQTEFSEYIENIKTDPQVMQLGCYFDDIPDDLRSHAIAEP